MPDFSSDGWVLHALARAGGTSGASLERLVFVGNAINHSVFGATELSDSLGRLIAAGLATATEDGYAVTTEVARLLGKGGLTRQRNVADRLVRERVTAAVPASGAAPNESACRSAIEAYLERADAVVREAERRTG